jgi:heat shock protein HspQ
VADGPFCLGDYVADSYGHQGRITQIDHRCEEPEEWIAAQSQPVTDAERKQRWCHVLVHNGGSVVVPESRLTHVDPFPLNNSWESYYFRP